MEEIKLENKYINIEEWHLKGFKGQNVVIWNTEGSGSHAEIVSRRVKDAAPESLLLQASLEMSYDSTQIKYANVTFQGQQYTVEDFIKKYGVKVITRSVAGKSSPEHISQYWVSLKEKYNLIMLNASGNDGNDGIAASFPHEAAWYVGACRLSSGVVKTEEYSALSEAVDFATFVGVWSGTSFACPYLAGQVALLLQRYNMTEKEAYKYLVMISKDVGSAGKDSKTGHGLPIFPSINRKYITMTTEGTRYQVDGKELVMDTKPVNRQGNVFVPVRVISEALGAKVEWAFNPDKSIRVTIDGRIQLNTGSDAAFIDGRKVFLNFAPYIDENNRTLVPIRFIAEALNCKVDWVQKESKVMILGPNPA